MFAGVKKLRSKVRMHGQAVHQYTGIDIAPDGIRYVSLSRKKNRVLDFGFISLPLGLIQQGHITDTEQIVQALKRVGRDITNRTVHCAVPESLTSRFAVSVPTHAHGSDIRNIIFCSIEEHIPLSPEEITFSYQLGTPNARGEVVAHVIAFPLRYITRLQRICAAARLHAVKFSSRTDMIVRSVIPTGDTQRNFIIMLDAGTAQCIVCEAGVVVSVQEYTTEYPEQFADAMYEHIEYADIHAIYVSGFAATPVTHALMRHIQIPVYTANVWENVPHAATYVPPIQKTDAETFAAAIGLALVRY